MTGPSMTSFEARLRSPVMRVLLLVAYYVLVQLAVLAVSARSDFAAPEYIYQAF